MTPSNAHLAYTDIAFQTEDGETLHGFWIPSPHPPSLGSILYCHGNCGNVGSVVLMAKNLAEDSFDVLLFDYRGFGQSTGDPTEEGTYRDARAASDELRKRPGVNDAHIIYLGESLGGAVATNLAVERPAFALVLQSTFASIKEEKKLHYPRIPDFPVPDAYPSVRRISKLRCPVLIVHGDHDNVVPLDQGKELFAAAPEPKRLEVFPEAGHNLRLEEAQRYASLIADWVRGLH